MRVVLLTHQDFRPPESLDGLSQKEMAPWRTEYDVLSALEELGHEVKILGAVTELPEIRDLLQAWKPHVVFNLLEEFRGEGVYVPFVLGYLQLMRQPFTGCNPASLLLVDDKPLTKKVLRHHRVPRAGLHGDCARTEGASAEAPGLPAHREVVAHARIRRHLAKVGRGE